LNQIQGVIELGHLEFNAKIAQRFNRERQHRQLFANALFVLGLFVDRFEEIPTEIRLGTAEGKLVVRQLKITNSVGPVLEDVGQMTPQLNLAQLTLHTVQQRKFAVLPNDKPVDG
jgi:hypothetical protein